MVENMSEDMMKNNFAGRPEKWQESAKILGKNRIDKSLAMLAGISREQAKKIIISQHVFVNQMMIQAPDYQVATGDILRWQIPEPTISEIKAEAITLNILYEDQELLVVDKPAFMCVHPAAGQWQGTLVNALLSHCGKTLSGIGGVRRPGIVHRIDKDTSGILVVAKNDDAHQFLSKQFAQHTIERVYDAFVQGIVKQNYAKLEGYIGRHPIHRKKMALRGHNSVDREKNIKNSNDNRNQGKHAIMEYHCQKRYGNVAAKIKCTLYTGRTHQIRVQMAAEKLPLIGDATYGSKREIVGVQLARQALHATYLAFTHPQTGERLKFNSELPEDLQILEKQLEQIT